MSQLRLCGCKESCFVRGDAVWGYDGALLCLHASEEHDTATDCAVGICGLTGERVEGYISAVQYENALILRRKGLDVN